MLLRSDGEQVSSEKAFQELNKKHRGDQEGRWAKKRSDFLAEAAREKLKRLRLDRAIEKAAGLWTDERYPAFRTEEDVRSHIRSSRKEAEKRLKAKLHAAKLPSNNKILLRMLNYCKF